MLQITQKVVPLPRSPRNHGAIAKPFHSDGLSKFFINIANLTNSGQHCVSSAVSAFRGGVCLGDCGARCICHHCLRRQNGGCWHGSRKMYTYHRIQSFLRFLHSLPPRRLHRRRKLLPHPFRLFLRGNRSVPELPFLGLFIEFDGSFRPSFLLGARFLRGALCLSFVRGFEQLVAHRALLFSCTLRYY